MQSVLPPLDPKVLAAATQFTAPLLAADAIDIRAIVRDAQNDGVENSRIEIGIVGFGGGSIVVKCSVEMALRLLCAWTDVADRAPFYARDTALFSAVTSAGGAAFGAYDRAQNDGWPADH
jgi:hypothetical protein